MDRCGGFSASVLAAPLVDGPTRILRVAHASRLAWQLADDHDRVVTCVIFPGAVRLPHAMAVPELSAAPSLVSVGGGVITLSGRSLPLTRWWRPARPRTSALRRRVVVSSVHDLAARVPRLIGLGAGLTPYGDDVVCGALVACSAIGIQEGAALVDAVSALDLDRRTTATSALLLRHAVSGYCIDEVADYLHALATGRKVDQARRTLLAVGHSSGAGLLEGIHRVVASDEREVAA
ncbi:MAG: DUF2877 domain-containing protein [Nocardioidaceae bacterium]